MGNRRMVLRIIATVSRAQLVRTRSRTRSPPTIRLPWNPPSRKQSSGSTPTRQRRKRSTKRNRSPSKESQCLFSRKWQEEPVVCPEECQVAACLTWVVVCPTWEVVHHQVLTQARDRPSRKSIKIWNSSMWKKLEH